MHERFAKMRRWLDREKDALLTFLIASGISILIGAGLALRHPAADLVQRRAEAQNALGVYRCAFGAADSYGGFGRDFPVPLPVLHSLPELYPLERGFSSPG